jgi:hypothetical protein
MSYIDFKNINFNQLLERENISQNIKDLLINFEENKNNISIKRSIYIYGSPGCGKTKFITQLLKEINYDIILYNASDIRNKNIIDDITKYNMSDKSVISMFQKRVKKIAIFMDEIDGMNSGDKGGINSLIKLIRPKKTKKQKGEEFSINPIICASNYHMDKKIKELMKVCHIFEIVLPTNIQIKKIINLIMPNIEEGLSNNIITLIHGDLRKLESIYNLYKHKSNIFTKELIENIFIVKSYSENIKEITKSLINNKISFSDHNSIINETDRTTIGLLWHENIVDYLVSPNKLKVIPLYIKLLDNICFADFIDRITFQKQIWQFNEMSSLIKIFYNNKIYHDNYKYIQITSNIKEEPNIKENSDINNINNINDIRFTKVLTKYSTEYNNFVFIQNLCQQLNIDKKDMFNYFINLKNNYSIDQIYINFQDCDISKLDINRIYRYLDKYIKNNCEIDDYNEDDEIIEKFDNYIE